MMSAAGYGLTGQRRGPGQVPQRALVVQRAGAEELLDSQQEINARQEAVTDFGGAGRDLAFGVQLWRQLWRQRTAAASPLPIARSGRP